MLDQIIIDCRDGAGSMSRSGIDDGIDENYGSVAIALSAIIFIDDESGNMEFGKRNANNSIIKR